MSRLSRLVGRLRTRMIIMLAAALATGGAVCGIVATATPAQAYTCSGWYYNYLSDGSAAASIHFGIYCSDARSHVYGTVYDIKCDARSAYLHLRFYNGSNAVAYRNEYPSDGNGCGSSATFSYSSTNTRPYLYGCVYAANGGPTQSSGDCDWIGGNQP